jgi:hypothetical protein
LRCLEVRSLDRCSTTLPVYARGPRTDRASHPFQPSTQRGPRARCGHAVRGRGRTRVQKETSFGRGPVRACRYAVTSVACGSQRLASRRPRSGLWRRGAKKLFRNKVGRSAMDEPTPKPIVGRPAFFSAMPWNPLGCGSTVHRP